MTTAEHDRLADSPDDSSPWRLWGPYVSGRQWGTVREDYSADGDAWNSFPFDHSHRRAYRWGEDGIGGLCDRYGFLNLTVALWNGRDDRLKERYFGLANGQGNHGEDVKEYWWPLDATPTHSYSSYLYRYPQSAFPYEDLIATNGTRSKNDPEYELADTGLLDGDAFFDVTIVHAKAAPDDIVMEIHVRNCGAADAAIDVLPQLTFRNTWSWGRDELRPSLTMTTRPDGTTALLAEHAWLGRYLVIPEGSPRILLCENDTDPTLWSPKAPTTGLAKNAIDQIVVHGESPSVPASGTKAALWWHLDVAAGGEATVRLRLVAEARADDPQVAAEVLSARLAEADAFYAGVIPAGTSTEDAFIARRAFAGLLWGKQVYHYSVREWLEGDPAGPPPPPERRLPAPYGRNTEWTNIDLADVMSMPDEWEYPWFAAWDLAFHCVALAHIDPAFAKSQLLLLCREWVMHPNGQMAAYEWKFSSVNPPVHAWAAWLVFQLDGGRDRVFLTQVFAKLLLNFGWWVNRLDADGSYLFEGGFLGMDNIGPFDRSAELPVGQILEQSDATSWMAFSSLSMLVIALELVAHDESWQGMATKFLEYYLRVASAMETFGPNGVGLWDETDGFFYDVLKDKLLGAEPVRVRSMVGLLPLLGVAVFPHMDSNLSDFQQRLVWLMKRDPELMGAVIHQHGQTGWETTLSVVRIERLQRVLNRLLDPKEFLSDHGIRALSAEYRHGIDVAVSGRSGLWISYQPAESTDYMFGGNSNWRGPVWLPVNVLLIDALRRYGEGFAEGLTFEYPVGSHEDRPLAAIADDLEQRLISLFRLGPTGRRPSDPHHVPTGPLWQAHPTFSEYFNGDDGSGLGASHQTGWTALVAHLICHPSMPDVNA